MPAVEDFPPVTQREYRAKVGYPPQDTSHAVEDPPRRGLLRRILGRSKRADVAQNVDPYEYRLDEPNHAAGPPAQDHGWANSVADDVSTSRETTDAEQPFAEIFGRQRK